jgi:hypothetical protein
MKWLWLWLVSGPAIGLVLAVAPSPIGYAMFTAAIVLETGHVVSPIILAWWRTELRRLMVREWRRSIALPALLVGSVFLLPISAAYGIYTAWNVYHFGMQHYGIASIVRPGLRPDARLACVGATVLGMVVLPFLLHDRTASLLIAATWGFNHWIMDIGLSSRVSGRPIIFAVLVLALGCIGFAWLVPRVDHVATYFVPWIICARWGLGMIHFAYSARIWQFSDPQIRAIVEPGIH